MECAVPRILRHQPLATLGARSAIMTPLLARPSSPLCAHCPNNGPQEPCSLILLRMPWRGCRCHMQGQRTGRMHEVITIDISLSDRTGLPKVCFVTFSILPFHAVTVYTVSAPLAIPTWRLSQFHREHPRQRCAYGRCHSTHQLRASVLHLSRSRHFQSLPAHSGHLKAMMALRTSQQGDSDPPMFCYR